MEMKPDDDAKMWVSDQLPQPILNAISHCLVDRHNHMKGYLFNMRKKDLLTLGEGDDPWPD